MNILAFLAFLLCSLFTLSACSVTHDQPTPAPDMANPASVFCEENGYKLEIRTIADGSQSGVCVFPDGSECDEWAYFRGECGLATPVNLEATLTTEPSVVATNSNVENASGGFMMPGTSEVISDWWGVIKSTERGAQYDDYFERQDMGHPYIYFGIDSMTPEVRSQIEILRDSGKIVHLYGTLLSNVPDFNGSQILVEQIEE
jgi:putative hemolysin